MGEKHSNDDTWIGLCNVILVMAKAKAKVKAKALVLSTWLMLIVPSRDLHACTVGWLKVSEGVDSAPRYHLCFIQSRSTNPGKRTHSIPLFSTVENMITGRSYNAWAMYIPDDTLGTCGRHVQWRSKGLRTANNSRKGHVSITRHIGYRLE